MKFKKIEELNFAELPEYVKELESEVLKLENEVENAAQESDKGVNITKAQARKLETIFNKTIALNDELTERGVFLDENEVISEENEVIPTKNSTVKKFVMSDELTEDEIEEELQKAAEKADIATKESGEQGTLDLASNPVDQFIEGIVDNMENTEDVAAPSEDVPEVPELPDTDNMDLDFSGGF